MVISSAVEVCGLFVVTYIFVQKIPIDMKRIILLILAITMPLIAYCKQKKEENMQTSQPWDKVFPLSKNVNHRKVEFKNRYGITLIGDLYTPKRGSCRMALAVKSKLR